MLKLNLLPVDRPGYVYLIGDDGLYGKIKIGWAKCPLARIAILQTGSPRRLTLLGMFVGDRGDESRLQGAFRHLRGEGEWFDVDHDLLHLAVALGAVGRACGNESCRARVADQFRSQILRKREPRHAARAAIQSL